MGRLRNAWHALRAGKPGDRFAESYRRRQKHHTGRGDRLRILAGAGLVLVGCVLLVIPGPGIPFLVVGAGLLAEESLPFARLLDRLELRVRDLIARVRRPAANGGP